jgi:predicted TPR repeat methyltransferase
MDNYKNTFQTWDKVASVYQDKFMTLDLYDDTYDVFCRLVEKINPKIFEIGCGPGNITKYMLRKRPDFILEGIDASPNMIKLAGENNPAAQFTVMDCRKIAALTSRFDAVICGFCMPYLTKDDCLKLISDCSILLNEGGLFYFSTIENDYDKSGFETSSDGQHTMFIYYHQEDYLRSALEENNFEVLELIRKNYKKNDGRIEINLIVIAKKVHA